jgi:predicted membrane GTPase involved in stress response
MGNGIMNRIFDGYDTYEKDIFQRGLQELMYRGEKGYA